jgi:hypothetical protein
MLARKRTSLFAAEPIGEAGVRRIAPDVAATFE